MNWTKDQQKVIDLRNRNILVSAAAGSGKTAVLVERIIKMVTEGSHPLDIDHLLIVTFTSAAAGEMRERIANAIEKRLEEDKENMHLQKQMTLVHSAQITTIHSFCLSVIRNYFNQIDLDPGFRIGDEAEFKLMKSDVISDIFETRYEAGEENFLAFTESFAAGKSDAGLEEMVLKLYEFSMSYPNPEEWLRGTLHAFDAESPEEFEKVPFIKDLIGAVKELLTEAAGENRKALELSTSGNGPYMYEEALLADREIINMLLACGSYKEYGNKLAGIEWKRLSAKKDETVDASKREYVKELRNGVKACIQDIQKQFFFQNMEQSFLDMCKVKPMVEVLVSLAIEFLGEFSRKKEEKNLLDFSDLEHFALRILKKEGKPSSAAMELREVYDEILVDEYQDSNFVQEELLNSISREAAGTPNLFMVGDVKQSIYKFRQARPELFLKKYKSYQTEDSLYQKIDLQKNFRSRNEVIMAVNCLFTEIMQESLGGIAYDEEAALYMGAAYPETGEGVCGGSAEILLLNGKEEQNETVSNKELEGEAIALRIRELIESGYQVFDKGKYRRAEYKDIVILLRSMSGWSEEFVSILGDKNIPAYADTRTGYFSAVEVKTVLNYLLIIGNPLQDIPFTAVLQSVIGGFTQEELSEIRILETEKTMYESLKKYQSEGNRERLRNKIRDFLEQLAVFRTLSDYLSVYELLQEVYKKTSYYNYVCVLPGGAVRKGNLDMLLQKALDFESTSYQGLFHFNRYIEKLHQYDIDFGEAGNGEKEAVRIMSIHKSKGLEFPIVFLAGMGKSFNQQDARSRLVLHPDMGIGPDYIDYESRTKVPTLLKKVIQRKIVLENLGEELRVLYVAMTRAKEKLIMTGFVKDLEKKKSSWEKQKSLSFRELSGAGSFLDWVMPCALRTNEIFAVRHLLSEDLMAGEIHVQISEEEKKNRFLNWDSTKYLTKEKAEEIRRLMEFSYPFSREQIIKSKVSISELKRKEYEEPEEAVEFLYEDTRNEAYIPNFKREEKEVSGTKRGTLYHKIMECISFQEIPDCIKVTSELKNMISVGKIAQEDRKLIKDRHFVHFFETNLARRMVEAENRKQLFREQPFVFGVPASRVNQGLDSEETVLIQGIIDGFFEENGELVLLDYKTDRVKDEKELIDRYRPQLIYYKEALEKITGKKVKESFLYSFALEKEICLKIPLDN